MQKFRKNGTTDLHVLHERILFDVTRNCFKIKTLNLDQIRTFLWKIDYVPFENLWMSNFMQEIRKSETTGLQILHERRLFDVTKNASKLKCLISTKQKFFKRKLIMSLLSIYQCLTSCKKAEKTQTTGLQVLHERRLFDLTKNASKLKRLIWTI